MVNQIFLSKMLESKQNFFTENLRILIGLDCDTYIAILDTIDIINEDNNIIQISEIEQISEQNQVQYISSQVYKLLPGNVKILGFMISQKDKINEEQKNNIIDTINKNFQYYKESEFYLKDQIMICFNSQNDLYIHNISFSDGSENTIQNVKIKRPDELVKFIGIKINKKFYKEVLIQAIQEQKQDDSDLDQYTQQMLKLINDFLDTSQFFDDQIKLKEQSCVQNLSENNIRILDPKIQSLLLEDTDKTYDIFHVNFYLCCYSPLHHNWQHVIKYLKIDIEKSINERLQISSQQMLSKRLMIDNGRMIYSFYINNQIQSFDNLIGFQMLKNDNIQQLDNENINIFDNKKNFLKHQEVIREKRKSQIIEQELKFIKLNTLQNPLNQKKEKQDINDQQLIEDNKEYKGQIHFYFVLTIIVIAFLIKKLIVDRQLKFN